MIYNLSEEYPVIAADEAKKLGYMKGGILTGGILTSSRLTAILCVISDRRVQIPLENAVIGTDAVMIRKSSMANTLFTDGQAICSGMEVYTDAGSFAGRVTAFDVGGSLHLSGIYTESGYIDAENIIKIGDVVLVDSEAANDRYEAADASITLPGTHKEEPCRTEPSEEDYYSTEPDGLEHTGIEPVSTISVETASAGTGSTGTGSSSMGSTGMEPVEAGADGTHSSSEDAADEAVQTVNARYKYLLGKKLINSISVDGRVYPDNSVVTEELIEAAIKSSCILSLIMNTED